MKTILMLLAASAVTASVPAAAQHQGHHMPAPAKSKPAAKKPAAKKVAAKKKPAAQKPAAKKKPAARESQAKKPAAIKPVVTKPTSSLSADPHAGHAMPEQPDPHAGHAMPAEQPDPHAGHVMPEQPDPHAGHAMPSADDPHAGHDMSAVSANPPVAPPPPEALSGPEHAADPVYGVQAMAQSREDLRKEHGALPAYRLFVERAETRIRRGADSYLLDAQAWYGGDIDKLCLKGELEGEWNHGVEEAEGQALWSHAINPLFDVQSGVRYDARRGADRAHLVLGLQGLAPYWWEVDGALFLSNKGEITARAEAEYDLRITQKLILQPRAELNLSLQNNREIGIGAGLSDAAVGLRLRYQISPLLAPYFGVEYERAFGRTARYRRDEGERAKAFSLLAGVRFWF